MQDTAQKRAQPLLKRPLKALVVNDSLLERLALGKMCALAGFQVLEATSEDNLIDYIEREQIDLVVCDAKVGDQDGLEICGAVRAAKLDFFVYILMLSPNDSEVFTVRALESGADEHLLKPLNKPYFSARISSVQESVGRQKSYYSTRAELPDSLQHLYRDMRAMSSFQRARLPKRRSVVQGLKVDYVWIPKIFVSGDLFDVFALDDQHVAFYVLDVVGHGVPSALRVMDLSQLLSAHPKDGILLEPLAGGYGNRVRQPAEVLASMNHRFQMGSGNEVYFSMMYGLFNLHSGVVTVSTAGLPMPWIQDLEGNLQQLGEPSFPIGVDEGNDYHDYSQKMEAGMRLFVCSDGLTQIQDAQDNELKVSGVEDLIKEGVQKTVHQQVEAFQNGLSHWVSGKNTDRLFENDATLLALQWRNQGDDDLFEDKELEYDLVEVQDDIPENLEIIVEQAPEFKFLPRKEASTVLLWRDEKSWPELKDLLGEWGYFPTESNSREECIRASKNAYHSFLLIDLQRLDQLDEHFFSAIRQGQNPSIFVLVLSNSANKNGLAAAMQSGADSNTQFDYSSREIYTRLNTGLRLATIHRSIVLESESASELRADIEKDLLRISNMQLENLPKTTVDNGEFQFELFFQPAGLLSNHYMNVITLADGCVAYFHLTSEGQGLVGAARGLSIYRQLSVAAIDKSAGLSQYMGEQFSPAAILRELNSQLLQNGLGGENCALCYGVLNPSTRVGRVAHAGYPLNVILRAKGEAELLGTYGSSLGVSVESQFQDVFYTLNPGDRLFVFPPDLNVNAALNGLVYESPIDFLRTTSNLECKEVVTRLADISSSVDEVQEDQSMLLFQLGHYTALRLDQLQGEEINAECRRLSMVLNEPLEASKAIRIHIPANIDVLPDVIGEAENTLATWSVDPDSLSNFQLVLLELTSNVCRHSGLEATDSFEFLTLALPKSILFVIIDKGVEMPSWLLESAREHDYEFDVDVEADIPTGGLGLPLVNSISSRFVHCRFEGHNYAFVWFDI